jgi:hypothetical protein
MLSLLLRRRLLQLHGEVTAMATLNAQGQGDCQLGLSISHRSKQLATQKAAALAAFSQPLQQVELISYIESISCSMRPMHWSIL